MDKDHSIGRRKENAAATERVVQLINRNRDIVSEVWRNYVIEGRLLVAPPVKNYEDKSIDILHTMLMMKLIMIY